MVMVPRSLWYVLAAIIVLIVLLPAQKTKIPKIIWSFWDSDERPEFIQKCIASWKKYNPDYEIHVVSKSTLGNFLPQDEVDKMVNWKFNDGPQRLSDLVRLQLLEVYGGIWLDASIVCFKSFNWVHSENADCILFADDKEYPLIHSWFIAAVPQQEFVRAWNREFRGVENYASMDEYRAQLSDRDKRGADDNYLIVYGCAQKVYNATRPKSVKLLNPDKGPFEYFTKGGIDAICDYRTSFAKLRKDEREKMTPELEKCLFRNDDWE